MLELTRAGLDKAMPAGRGAGSGGRGEKTILCLCSVFPPPRPFFSTVVGIFAVELYPGGVKKFDQLFLRSEGPPERALSGFVGCDVRWCNICAIFGRCMRLAHGTGGLLGTHDEHSHIIIGHLLGGGRSFVGKPRPCLIETGSERERLVLLHSITQGASRVDVGPHASAPLMPLLRTARRQTRSGRSVAHRLELERDARPMDCWSLARIDRCRWAHQPSVLPSQLAHVALRPRGGHGGPLGEAGGAGVAAGGQGHQGRPTQ